MKTLSQTNPYLINKEEARFRNERSTRTSCGVEGIVPDRKVVSVSIDKSKSAAVFAKIKDRLDKS
jgi:hypothetical protein